jgi:hypothetical protein
MMATVVILGKKSQESALSVPGAGSEARHAE